MKQITTPTRYTEKCAKLQRELPGTNYTISQICKIFGGSWYFYKELFERGYLRKEGIDEYVKWHGELPSEKEMRKIARRVNTMNRNVHRKYAEKHISKPRVRKEIDSPAPVIDKNPTINLFIREIESELQAHRSNGASSIHLENVVRLTRDMEKIMD